MKGRSRPSDIAAPETDRSPDSPSASVTARTRRITHVQRCRRCVATENHPQGELCVALVVHKSQGMTCDVTLVLGDDTLHAEAGYTAMTRGRIRNHLYTVADDASDPLASVRRALARSTAKTTAHEHLGIAR